MNEITEGERVNSLIAVYNYLETRHKEQLDALKSVDSSVKTRVAVLSAALGIVTFLAGGVWKVPGLKDMLLAHVIVIASFIPVYFMFILTFLRSMNVLDRQESVPDFILSEFVDSTTYSSLRQLWVSIKAL